jgi:hypothetical protein
MHQRPSRQFAADLFAPPWLVPGDPFTGLVRADLVPSSPTARAAPRVTRRRVPLTRTRAAGRRSR